MRGLQGQLLRVSLVGFLEVGRGEVEEGLRERGMGGGRDYFAVILTFWVWFERERWYGGEDGCLVVRL